MNKIVNKKFSREGEATAKLADSRVRVSDYILALGLSMYLTNWCKHSRGYSSIITLLT